MHIGDPDDCLFGCRGSDALRHYMSCGFLRRLMHDFENGCEDGTSPARCFGFAGTDSDRDSQLAFRRAALVTAAYHAVRARHCVSPASHTIAREIAGAYARDIWPELACAFSPPRARLQHPPAGAEAHPAVAGRPPGGRSAPVRRARGIGIPREPHAQPP